MAKLFANNADPDQMPHYAASDLGLHCQLPFYGSPDYNGLRCLVKAMGPVVQNLTKLLANTKLKLLS